jgi:UDP-N-acetylglucosamine--N-acetylmuramyl-(pentapeptide) pyrophosphoryl-undecaprenol N-acetylglucosamine transferase
MMTPSDHLIVLSAGGTGGHVFPAEALAQHLSQQGYRLALVTDRRGKAYKGTLGTLTRHEVRAGGVAGKGAVGRIFGLLDVVAGTLQAIKLLKTIQPAAVVGFGGYASVPAMAAAIHLGIPCLLHEQNAVLGRANRLLARRVSAVATSFDKVRLIPEKTSTHFVGMPVRQDIADVRPLPYPALTTETPLEIVVIGGSQGARVFSDVLPDAMAMLPPDLRQRIHLTQQCRPEDLERVQSNYAQLGVTATLESFFSNMPELLQRAHLLIGRSGASTVAEAATAGRPAIMVPYPYAADDHQTYNAHALDAVGGGWLMPQDHFTAATVAERLKDFLNTPTTLIKAAQCAKSAGKPDAAHDLAQLVTSLISPTAEPAHANTETQK